MSLLTFDLFNVFIEFPFEFELAGFKYVRIYI